MAPGWGVTVTQPAMETWILFLPVWIVMVLQPALRGKTGFVVQVKYDL